jgi:hypothetical protein
MSDARESGPYRQAQHAGTKPRSWGSTNKMFAESLGFRCHVNEAVCLHHCEEILAMFASGQLVYLFLDIT